MIEARGFRYYGHFQGDSMLYFTDEEKARNRARDPIATFRKRVLDRKLVSEAELDAIDAKVELSAAMGTKL